MGVQERFVRAEAGVSMASQDASAVGGTWGTIFNQKERLQRYSIEVSRRGNFSFFTDVVPSITPGLAQA